MKQFEYVVSAGEGTLLDHGQCDFIDVGDLVDALEPGQDVSVALAAEECETGL